MHWFHIIFVVVLVVLAGSCVLDGLLLPVIPQGREGEGRDDEEQQEHQLGGDHGVKRSSQQSASLILNPSSGAQTRAGGGASRKGRRRFSAIAGWRRASFAAMTAFSLGRSSLLWMFLMMFVLLFALFDIV